MLSSSILNSITFKNVPVPNLYPNMTNCLHADRRQGNFKVIPYFQKYQKDHVVYLQFESDSASSITLASFLETVQIESWSVAYTSTYGTSNIRYYTNFAIILGSSYYENKIWFKATQDANTLTSEPVFVTDLTDDIAKGRIKYIQYSNLFNNLDELSDLDDHFIDWASLASPGYCMDMFVNAVDIEPNDTDETTILEGSQSQTIIAATYYSGRILQTGGVPDYMATKLSMAANLNLFMVNDIQYVKSAGSGSGGGTEIERFGLSTLYQVSLTLTQMNAIGINVDSLGISADVTTPPVSGTPMYIGSVTSAVPGETEVKLITPITAVKANQTISYTVLGGRFCFAYPTTFGSLVSILDPTNDEIISGFNVTTLYFTIGVSTINFTIYTLKSPCTVTSFTVIYKFS